MNILRMGLFLIIVLTSCTRNKKNIPTIAITQIVEHTSLDQERDGLLNTLKQAGYIQGETLNVIYQNAQGNSLLSTQIAQKFMGSSPDIIIAISTPSAQSVLSARGQSKIPIIFMAVTDPINSRLVKSLDFPGNNITGVCDYLNPIYQYQFILSLIPNLKNLGILYNPGESNSAIMYSELKKAANILKINLKVASVTQTSEVTQATLNLVDNVDAIYIPNDNTVVSGIQIIVNIGIKKKLPIFAGDIGSVYKGAAGAVAYDRFNLGTTAANMILEILKGKKVGEIPIKRNHSFHIMMNYNSAKAMGLRISKENTKNVTWINEALSGELK